MHYMIVVAYMRMVCVTRLWSSANLLRFHPVALNRGVMFKGVKIISVSQGLTKPQFKDKKLIIMEGYI